jgi:hypothetical protein
MAGELSTPRQLDVGSRVTGTLAPALKHLVEESERTKLLLFLESRKGSRPRADRPILFR